MVAMRGMHNRLGRAVRGLVFMVVLAVVSLGAPQAPAAAETAAVTLPPGFTDELVTPHLEPTDLAFLPDGSLVATTKGGAIGVYAPGTFAFVKQAIHLGSRMCYNKERGLQGIAVDPNFVSNRYLYLYYAYKKHGECPIDQWNNPKNPVNRVSRFTLSTANTIALNSEVVLIDNIPAVTGNHNAGGMFIGKDGYLYVSVGDSACHFQTGGCGVENTAARDLYALSGKILRIALDGSIPPGNPYTGADSDRCNASGATTAGRKCREIFASGLRNPFRIAADPNASGTRFFINDVGQQGYDEVDEGLAGADYGWPCREGAHNLSAINSCVPLPPGLVDPVYEYNHNTGCSSITGGAFVPEGAWPAEYQGAYLFADYMCGKIFRLSPNGSGGYAASQFASGMGNSSATATRFGPYNGGQALYYASFANGGEIRRIAYAGAPVAAFTATPTTGALPLLVNFDASGSQNPSGGALTYAWNFGDGTQLAGQTSPLATHTYTAAGVYTPTLVVSGGGKTSSPARTTIYAGSAPPQPVLTLPDPGAGLAVGDVVTVNGSATDAEDGSLPASALSWEVRLHHVDEVNPGTAHYHPFDSAAGTASLSFEVPAPEDLQATRFSYLEVRLTATDSDGLTTVVTDTVQPRRVNVVFTTNPPGLKLTIRGLEFTTPVNTTLWTNWTFSLSAPQTQPTGTGSQWVFRNWSDGGAREHDYTAPDAPDTVTANYAVNATRRIFFPFGGRSGALSWVSDEPVRVSGDGWGDERRMTKADG